MKRRLLDSFFLSAVVHSTERLGPRMRRIELDGPALTGLGWVPGQQVRLQVAAQNAAVDWLIGTLRTYSVWDYHGQQLELIIFDHSDGPGAQWGRTVEPGDEVRLLKPQGDFVVADAPHHLFVGEETASVAFGPMLRALPATADVRGVIEVESPKEQLTLDRELVWLHRDGGPAASSATLLAAVAGLDLPAEPGIAYVAGEARTVQSIRNHLVADRGWPRRSVRTKPFWAPGKKGLE
jgi:NADPH-dependent ferric siderophore reductase